MRFASLTERLRRRYEREVLHRRLARNRREFVQSCRAQGIDLQLAASARFFHPVRIFGQGGQVVIGEEVEFGFDGGAHWLGPVGLEIRDPQATLTIGRATTIMREVRLICFHRITIGEACAIGDGCMLLDSNAHDWTPGNFDKPDPGRPIILGNRVHIAPYSSVLKGVEIGDDSTIGTRSVVLSSLAGRSVAMGNPARVMHRYPTTDNEASKAKLSP